jgi:release factor glutamine methyltransferase
VLLNEHLRHGEARLRTGPHPERARLDAETLLLHLIGKNRAWLLTHLEDEFGGCKSISYAQQIERRLAGEPIQYITGECEFYGLLFSVNRDVLIPRPETEHLVEKVLALAPMFAGPRIVDVGTGSGAIAIAIAHEFSQAMVTAIDTSPQALEVAKANAKRIAPDHQIRFLQGDLLGPVTDEKFNIVASNPPYVPENDRNTLAVEVRDYEPSLALFAGAEGLELYRRLIPQAREVLSAGGYLVLEIGFDQRAAVSVLMREAGFVQIESAPDLQGIDRVLTGKMA